MGGRGDRNWGRISVPTKQTEYEFEFDENKSNSNKEKHGIDFKEAQALWKDEKRFVNPSSYIEEARTLLIAKYNEKFYTAVYTERNGLIRIISVRRSRDKEIKEYERENDKR
jgi:uncharacterized DUF497 family protein